MLGVPLFCSRRTQGEGGGTWAGTPIPAMRRAGEDARPPRGRIWKSGLRRGWRDVGRNSDSGHAACGRRREGRQGAGYGNPAYGAGGVKRWDGTDDRTEGAEGREMSRRCNSRRTQGDGISAFRKNANVSFLGLTWRHNVRQLNYNYFVLNVLPRTSPMSRPTSCRGRLPVWRDQATGGAADQVRAAGCVQGLAGFAVKGRIVAQ